MATSLECRDFPSAPNSRVTWTHSSGVGEALGGGHLIPRGRNKQAARPAAPDAPPRAPDAFVATGGFLLVHGPKRDRRPPLLLAAPMSQLGEDRARRRRAEAAGARFD